MERSKFLSSFIFTSFWLKSLHQILNKTDEQNTYKNTCKENKQPHEKDD